MRVLRLEVQAAMSVLGVKLAGNTAWLAVLSNARDVAEKPDRFTLPRRPRPQALLSATDQLQVLYEQESVTAVGVLDAHGNVKPRSFQAARSRFTIELLFELAAATAGVAFEVVAPATVQARLSLPTRRIEDHVDHVVEPVGTHWNHRGSAALAALAVKRGVTDAPER